MKKPALVCLVAWLGWSLSLSAQEIRFRGRAFVEPDEPGPMLLSVPRFTVSSDSLFASEVADQLTEVVGSVVDARPDSRRFEVGYRRAENAATGTWSLEVGRYQFGQVPEPTLEFYRNQLVACLRTLSTTQGRELVLNLRQGTGADVEEWAPPTRQAVSAMSSALQRDGCSRAVSARPVTVELEGTLQALAVGMLTEGFDADVFFRRATPTLAGIFHDFFYAPGGLYLLETQSTVAELLATSFDQGLLAANDPVLDRIFPGALDFFLSVEAPLAFRLLMVHRCGGSGLFGPPLSMRVCLEGPGGVSSRTVVVEGGSYLVIGS